MYNQHKNSTRFSPRNCDLDSHWLLAQGTRSGFHLVEQTSSAVRKWLVTVSVHITLFIASRPYLARPGTIFIQPVLVFFIDTLSFHCAALLFSLTMTLGDITDIFIQVCDVHWGVFLLLCFPSFLVRHLCPLDSFTPCVLP